MRRPVEPPALTAVSEVLADLSGTIAGVEEDLLSSLVVMGEPDAQHVVDGWVDQVVDLLRAVDEVSVQHRATLTLASSRHAARGAVDADSHAKYQADPNDGSGDASDDGSGDASDDGSGLDRTASSEQR